MKKIIIFALAALLCSFSLAGCSSDSEDGVPGKGTWQRYMAKVHGKRRL